jgi:hypothetical protein
MAKATRIAEANKKERTRLVARTAKNSGRNSVRPIEIALQVLFLLVLAEWTGLEPATPGVTGRYSNQLNYHSYWMLVGADGLEPPTFAL